MRCYNLHLTYVLDSRQQPCFWIRLLKFTVPCRKSSYHIYIYIIGHYSPSVITLLMLCKLILYVSGRTCSLTSNPNDRFVRNFFMAGFCEKSAEMQSPKKYFFMFCFDAWPGIRTRALCLISQLTTY